MFKILITLIFSLNLLAAHAESTCDIRMGSSIGIRVVEFVTGQKIHSKMAFKESTAGALQEEMINLQDMGICEEKIISRRCILKYERGIRGHFVVMFRGNEKWNSWRLSSKELAQNYIKGLKKVGFCS